jgi:hypothetical protein
VAKLSDATGTAMWARTFGPTESVAMSNLAVDPSGDALITGVYQQDLDFGLGALPSALPGGYQYIAKLSGADGTSMFSRSVQQARGFVTGTPLGFSFVGSLWGVADFGAGAAGTQQLLPVVASYGPTGNLLWTKILGDAAVTSAGAALPSATSAGLGAVWAIGGNIDFGGGQIPSAGGLDIFLTAYPPDGTTPKTSHFGSAANESPSSISLGADGSALVVGTVNGPLDFGPTDVGISLVTPQSPPDAFALFLAPN